MTKRVLLGVGLMATTLLACGGGGGSSTTLGPAATGSLAFTHVTGVAQPTVTAMHPTNGLYTLFLAGGATMEMDATLTTPVTFEQTLKVTFPGEPVAGTTYTVGGTGGVLFFETDKYGIQTFWTGKSGTIHVDSLVGSTYTVTLTNVVAQADATTSVQIDGSFTCSK